MFERLRARFGRSDATEQAARDAAVRAALLAQNSDEEQERARREKIRQLLRRRGMGFALSTGPQGEAPVAVRTLLGE